MHNNCEQDKCRDGVKLIGPGSKVEPVQLFDYEEPKEPTLSKLSDWHKSLREQ